MYSDFIDFMNGKQVICSTNMRQSRIALNTL